MKNIFICLLTITFFSCQPGETVPEITTITGVIQHAGQATKVKLNSMTLKETADIAEDGKFSFTIKDLKEGPYTIIVGREQGFLYLLPGQDVKVTLDADQFDESISFEGAGAAPNTYLAKKTLAKTEAPIDYKALFTADEAGFMEKVSALEKKDLEMLNSFGELPKSFVDFQKKAIHFEKLSYIGDYESSHGYFTDVEDFKASDEFKKPLANVKFDNESDFVKYDGYTSMVVNHFSQGEILDNLAKLKGVASPIIKDEVVKNLQYYMSPSSDDLKAVFEGLVANSTDEAFKESIEEKYLVFKELVKGRPSPKFDFVDRHGKKVKLDDLKGKNVYIDVWATWCGPCIREIPSLKTLEKTYHGKNIEFVSISIDEQKDAEKWKKMVQEKELKGVQLMADKDWRSDFVTGYGISGIPRFIMVDGEGKIVSADAPRPSAKKKVTKMFSELGI